jgi:hypothetical protein
MTRAFLFSLAACVQLLAGSVIAGTIRQVKWSSTDYWNLGPTWSDGQAPWPTNDCFAVNVLRTATGNSTFTGGSLTVLGALPHNGIFVIR